MNETMTLTLILAVLVAAMCCKWLAVILLYIPMALSAAGGRCRSAWLRRILRMPLGAVNRATRYGTERFVLYHVGFIPSVHLRKWLYKGAGARLGERVLVHFRAEIRCPEKLTLGEGTIIGDNAILDARRGLTMGRNVNLSSNVSIYTLQHDHRDPFFRCPQADKVDFSVEIGDRAWLGSNVIVLPGVHIGEGAVCCAGCVVTKDVEPYAVVAGIPARKVAERPRELFYEFSGFSCRFY